MKRLKSIFLVCVSMMLLSPALIAETAEKVAEHAKRKPPTVFEMLFHPRFLYKFLAMLLIGIAALVLLKMKKMNKGLKITLLLISTFLFGILGNMVSYFAMHPSPMCAATKALLFGFRGPFILTLAVIFLLTLIGPKLFCSYVCPVGAIQELIAMWADKLKLKRNKTSFKWAHTIRTSIFILFIFLSVTAVIHVVFKGKVYPQSLYDFINPFHGMEIGAEKDFLGWITHYVPFLLTVVLAFKYYRPFCHFVCPIGLFSHWLEQIGLFRVRFNKSACTDCNICVNKAPCTAVPDIMKESTLRPDCYGCDVCVDVCPENALDYGPTNSKKYYLK